MTTAPAVIGPAADLLAPLEEWRLRAAVRLKRGGPAAEREPITRADLDGALSELWFHGHVRRGAPDRAFEAIDAAIAPIFDPAGADGAGAARPRRANGYVLETTAPDGRPYRRVFSMLSLSDAAERAARRLLADGRLNPGADYFYDLEAGRGGPAPDAPPAPPGPSMRVVSRDPPLTWVEAPLRPLLEGARAVGTQDPGWCHVFYTREARERSERFSRLGASRTPAVETGAALLGTLAVCPETRDAFIVIARAIEVSGAQATTFSLEYTADSWRRIDGVVAAARRQPDTASWRLLGQAHGHNFMPADGAPPCAACATAAECGRTSVFVSNEDLTWTRAVFSRQPYAVSHIYGLTARHRRPRRDEVEGLFGVADGRLLRRGYHVIESFNPGKRS